MLGGLGDILFQTHKSEDALTARFLKKASSSSLKLDDFPHLTQDIQAINNYLIGALQCKEAGTNILFYGTSGTGKTECVKALAATLGIELYEISFADESGAPISGTSRLRAYNLCQRMLRSSDHTLLMFDEIEDVFPRESISMALFGIEDSGGNSRASKAWINRALERNDTPAIWVTNDANIDPAYLRRFDYSVRFSVPPQQVRMSIARHHLGQFKPSDAWLSRIAASEQVSPAQYERAAKVALLASHGDKQQDRLLVEQTLDRSARLLGQNRLPARNVLHEADSFLADRRDAQRNWEVTQVNELLTQMEAFEGIFVCTTNLLDKLDRASLRRFAFKVKFDFLNAEQRWAMFQNELARLGGTHRSSLRTYPALFMQNQPRTDEHIVS